tara:strand:- start:179 stop:727 length:549 start_codon:yes stop_codon:yes gene_type:complete
LLVYRCKAVFSNLHFEALHHLFDVFESIFLDSVGHFIYVFESIFLDFGGYFTFCILFSLTLIHLIPLVFFMNEARTSLFGDIFTYDYSQGPRRPKDTDILVGQLIQAHARHQRITLRQLNMTFSERGNKSYNNVTMKYLHERGYIHLNREPGRTRVTQILINRINECNLNVPTEYRAENTNR